MTSQDLLDRYGTAPRPWRRRAARAGVAVLAAMSLTWLGWTAWSHGTPTVESEIVGYDVEGPHAASAVVLVRVADDAEDVSCLLRAFAEDHTVVGDLAFTPEPSDGTQRIEQTVRTERQATSVDLVGCTAAGQDRPR